MESEEGVRLVAAFSKIADRKMRRGIARLTGGIAEHVQARVSADVLQLKGRSDEPAGNTWVVRGVSDMKQQVGRNKRSALRRPVGFNTSTVETRLERRNKAIAPSGICFRTRRASRRRIGGGGFRRRCRSAGAIAHNLSIIVKIPEADKGRIQGDLRTARREQKLSSALTQALDVLSPAPDR